MTAKEAKIAGYMYLGISELLKQSGICPTRFYQEFGLPSDIELHKEKLLPFSNFTAILSKLRTCLPYYHPSLPLSSVQHELNHSFYVDLLLNSPNLGAMLQNAIQYRQYFSEITYWDWHTDDNYLFIKRSSYLPSVSNDTEHCIYTVSYSWNVIKALFTAQDEPIEYISFIHSEDAGKQELLRYFSCPVRFDQDFDGFVLKKQRLLQANPNFNQKRYQQQVENITGQNVIFPDNQTFSSSVKCLIFSALSSGQCDVNTIASMLGVHQRTLQGRLLKEQTNFKQLVKEVRNTCAKRMLINEGLPLLKISRLLGYSELSAFTRAFKASEGASPKEWRKAYKCSLAVAKG